MIIYFYSLLSLLFLPIESSSIRDRNFKNDLVPSLSSRLDPFKKDSNSLKIVSSEPFIIQLQVPNAVENNRRKSKEMDTKRKHPTKKRVSKIKPLRKRHRRRRDLKTSKKETEKDKNSNQLGISDQSKNDSINSISKTEILKALSSYSKKEEMKKRKKFDKNIQSDNENGNESAKPVTGDILKTTDQKFLPMERGSFVKMAYPSTPKTNKRSHKYTYKDLMADRERLEKKIKYIRNMLNVSNADDLIRIRRRSESDRTANKIAKMFLTLSAVNGLNDRWKSKCDAEDDDGNYRVQDIWEKEREDSGSRKTFSSNEERYKVKKWIELMKSKRSSGRTCPCAGREEDDESDVFPLEQKLPKNYYLFQRGGSSEESLEAYRDFPSVSREKSNRNNIKKKQNHKARDDDDNWFKPSSGRVNKKLELPLDDLEVYRLKAKQILQNAEEILDRIKEEEEKRLSAPNMLMSQLRELTSRIQPDPRNNENDLIRKIQKNLDWGRTANIPDGTDGNNFLENVKSFILDPYEKAKALTDESTKKLSSYLLRNLGELQQSGEVKDDDSAKENLEVFFDQVPPKEEEKPFSANLAKEKSDSVQKSNENLKDWTETVSSILGGDVENKDMSDLSVNQEEQFKKRMQEMIKEQEKKLNEYEGTKDSIENSQEITKRLNDQEEKQGQYEGVKSEVTSEEQKVAAPLDHREDEDGDPENKKVNQNIIHENNKTPQEKAEKEFDKYSEKMDDDDVKVFKHSKQEEINDDVLEEIKKDFNEKEKNIESEVPSEFTELKSPAEGENKAQDENEDMDPMKSSYEKSNDRNEASEVRPEEQETNLGEAVLAESTNHHDPDVVSLSSKSFPSDSQNEANEKIDPEVSSKDPEEADSIEDIGSERREDVQMEAESNKNSKPDNLKALNFPTENAEDISLNDEKSKSESVQSETELQKPLELTPESLETIRSSEDGREEETLNLQSPDEESNQPEAQDQGSRTATDTEDKEGLTSSMIDDGNSNESFHGREKAISDDTENVARESPLASESSRDLKDETSKEFSEEIHPSDDAGNDESLQSYKNPIKEASGTEENEDNLEAPKTERQEVKNSNEESVRLQTETVNNQSDEVSLDADTNDKTIDMSIGSLDEGNEKTKYSDDNNETLKSVMNQSQEEPMPEDTFDETSRNADEDSQRPENDENQDDADNNFTKAAATHYDKNEKGNFESLEEKSRDEAISKEQNKDKSYEEEYIKSENPTLKSTDPNEEFENLERSATNDPIAKEESKEKPEMEDSYTLLGSPESQDPLSRKNLEDEIKDKSTEDMDPIGAALENQEKKNNNENDEDKISSKETKSNEESISRETTKYDTEKLSDHRDNADILEEPKDEDDKISLKAVLNKEDLSTSEQTNETPLKLENDDGDVDIEVSGKNENSREEINDDTSLRDENPLRLAVADNDVREESKESKKSVEEISDDTLMKPITNKNNDYTEDSEEKVSLKTMQVEDDLNRDDEENENTSKEVSDDAKLQSTVSKNNEENESTEDDVPLKANLNDDQSALEEDPETSLRAENVISDENYKEPSMLNKENTEEISEPTEDEDIHLRAENPNQRSRSSENDDETSLNAVNVEEFKNNNLDDDDIDETESEENPKASNTADNYGNQMESRNDADVSMKTTDGEETEFESSSETLQRENSLRNMEESDNPAFSAEELTVGAAEPTHELPQTDSAEEISPQSLQEPHPRKNSIKVPSSIAQIMKDLDGKEKDDITSIENLNPEKIDHIIDKIDEAEQQNKVMDEVDCRKECACAEDIDMRSRNIGRYEIVKDFLHWMKDLQLNQVLTRAYTEPELENQF